MCYYEHQVQLMTTYQQLSFICGIVGIAVDDSVRQRQPEYHTRRYIALTTRLAATFSAAAAVIGISIIKSLIGGAGKSSGRCQRAGSLLQGARYIGTTTATAIHSRRGACCVRGGVIIIAGATRSRNNPAAAIELGTPRGECNRYLCALLQPFQCLAHI